MTTHLIILYIVGVAFVVAQYFSLKQEEKTVQRIDRLDERCRDNGHGLVAAYLRLEARVTKLENGGQ